MKRICALLLSAALLATPAAAEGVGEGSQPPLDLSAASAVLMVKEAGSFL